MSQNLFFTARRLVAHTQFPPKSPFVYSSVDDRVLIPYPPSLPAKRRGQGKSKAINCWFIPLLHSSVVVDNINLVSFFFLLFSIWPNFHMLPTNHLFWSVHINPRVLVAAALEKKKHFLQCCIIIELVLLHIPWKFLQMMYQFIYV